MQQKIPEYCELLPSKIDDQMIIKEYYYQHVFRNFLDRYCMLLHVEYTPVGYEAEIKRLSSYSKYYKWGEIEGIGHFLYDSNCMHFYYPTYVAQYSCARQAYEYALLLNGLEIKMGEYYVKKILKN